MNQIKRFEVEEFRTIEPPSWWARSFPEDSVEHVGEEWRIALDYLGLGFGSIFLAIIIFFYLIYSMYFAYN